MILCLDIGNTHIFAGLFADNAIQLRFRYPSKQPCSSDVFGLFLKNVLRENGFDPHNITGISLSSVVPSLDYSVVAACIKYFGITPLELKPGIKTGLNLDIKNSLELGADRIANAVASLQQFPNKNIVVVNFSTATTVCAISKQRTFLGGAILPGFKISMESLYQNTAKLASVEIVKPATALGKATDTNIQAGLYYGQLGAIKEIVAQYKTHVFDSDEAVVLATGDYAKLFEQENYFTTIVPDLILHGLYIIWGKNNL